jgi:hypothetical protein
MNAPRPALWVLLALCLGAVGCATQQVDEDAAPGGGGAADTGIPSDDAGAPGFDIPTDFVVPKDDLGQPGFDAGNPLPPEDTGNPFPPEDTGNPLPPEDTGNPLPTDAGNPVPTDRGNPVDTGPRDAGPRDTGTPTGDGGSGCASATDCASCTAMSTCGWCAATRRCYDGTASGPRGATCAFGYAWLATSCGSTPVDPCRSATQCGDCTDRTSCGWCAATRQCLSGTSTGPLPGTAACPAIAQQLGLALPSQCVAPTDPCRTSTGCGSCTNRGSCGWCHDSDTCHTGTSSGPSQRRLPRQHLAVDQHPRLLLLNSSRP